MNESQPIKACIFDLDGVIVDTAHYHFLAWKRLADELAVHFTEKENENLKGISRVESLEYILELGEIELNMDEKIQLMDRKNEWYKANIQDMSPADVLPGVENFMQELEENGIQAAIASSSKNAPTVVEKINFSKRINALVDGNMVKRGKPDPELFVLAASKMNVDPAYCIVFEDAYSGIEAAIAAGMRNVGIGKANALDIADHVMDGFQDFTLNDLKKIFS